MSGDLFRIDLDPLFPEMEEGGGNAGEVKGGAVSECFLVRRQMTDCIGTTGSGGQIDEQILAAVHNFSGIEHISPASIGQTAPQIKQELKVEEGIPRILSDAELKKLMNELPDVSVVPEVPVAHPISPSVESSTPQNIVQHPPKPLVVDTTEFVRHDWPSGEGLGIPPKETLPPSVLRMTDLQDLLGIEFVPTEGFPPKYAEIFRKEIEGISATPKIEDEIRKVASMLLFLVESVVGFFDPEEHWETHRLSYIYKARKQFEAWEAENFFQKLITKTPSDEEFETIAKNMAETDRNEFREEQIKRAQKTGAINPADMIFREGSNHQKVTLESKKDFPLDKKDIAMARRCLNITYSYLEELLEEQDQISQGLERHRHEVFLKTLDQRINAIDYQFDKEFFERMGPEGMKKANMYAYRFQSDDTEGENKDK